MAQPGDYVKIITSSSEYTGRYMPSKDEHIVNIKLDNGYNIGLQKESVSKVEVLEGHQSVIKDPKEHVHKKGLPTVSILHTGGTIASRIDYRTGGVFSSFKPEELIAMFPELEEIANFESRLVANMWSDDLRFDNIKVLAKAVEEELARGVDGIIIGMGTDNLAVASAALSFMVQNSPVPILFVGSQRSSDRGSSDAAMNLICATKFIAKSDWSGVGICMHAESDDTKCNILSGTKTYKMHSSRRDAFTPVNSRPLAYVNYLDDSIEMVAKKYTKKDKDRKADVKLSMEDKVGYIRVHVHMFPEEILIYKDFKGVVIEGTGLGLTPGHTPNPESMPNKAIFDAFKTLQDNGVVMVMTTQTLFGRTGMNVYSKGRDLLDFGIIPGEDMLANTAFVKLAWLLGNHSAEEAKELARKNLVGEISERTLYD